MRIPPKGFITAAACALATFALCFLVFRMGPALLALVTALVAAGVLLLFVPGKWVVNGIDITRARGKKGLERDIREWSAKNDALTAKIRTAGNAYVTIKGSQMLEVAGMGLARLQGDFGTAGALKQLLPVYYDTCIRLVEAYTIADRAADNDPTGPYQAKKEALRASMDALVGQMYGRMDDALGGNSLAMQELLKSLDKAGKEAMA